MPDSGDLRAALVSELRKGGTIRTVAVASAFSEVPRELFIPEVVAEGGLEKVYRDEAHVTKKDSRGMALSSSSQPAMMAEMLELLELELGHRVLEIGAGTGYNAALLSRLVGPSGSVVTIDVDPDIAARAHRALRDAGAAVDVVVGDGRLAFAAGAPYDRIVVTASADEIPRAWLEQLGDGGRLIVPMRLDPDGDAIHVIPVFVRRGQTLRATGGTSGGFMPLHGGEGVYQVPTATLSASRHSGSRHEGLISLTGSGVERLSNSSARLLLAALLGSRPRIRAQGSTPLFRDITPGILIYLMVKIPAGRRAWIAHSGRHGVALIDPRGPGVAAVTVPNLWSLPSRAKVSRWRLEGWGEKRALAELNGMVSAWRALERERRDQLEITALPAGETLRLNFRWADRSPLEE